MPKSALDNDNIQGGGSGDVAVGSSFFCLYQKDIYWQHVKSSVIIPVDVLLARAITTPAEMAGGLFQ